MTQIRPLVIIGAGGIGQEMLWAASRMNAVLARFELRGFCDDDPGKQSGTYRDLPLLGSVESAAKAMGDGVGFVCGIGHNRLREQLSERAEKCGWLPVAIVDPSVVMAADVEVGLGCYVAALTVLSPNAKIGRHVIINHGCSIGHDSRIEDFGQICPGARISGNAVIGRSAFVGSNAVVGPGGAVHAGAVLGANSFAVRPIPPGSTAVGNPARVVFKAPVDEAK